METETSVIQMSKSEIEKIKENPKYTAPVGGTYSVVYNGKTYTVTVEKDEDLNEAVIKLIKQGNKNEK